MTNQPDAPKTGRRHRRLSVAKRNVLLALSVFVFALGLVGSPVGDPPLFDEAEPAAASHCGPGDLQWLCILAENCANSGGTLVGLTCVVPTTTAPPTTTQPPPTTTLPPSPTPQQQCASSGGTWTIYGCWHQPSCPSGQQWVPSGSVNGACTPCPSGQHSHTTCHADHTCATGQHLNGHSSCHADHTCATGQHLNGHSSCHADHTCSAGQVLYDHDQCRAAPVQCTASPGQHKHTLLNNQVHCHDDHTCETGEHLDGHDTCHADHACSAGEVLYDHDECRTAAPQQCTPSVGEHTHSVTNLNQVYCHADHACSAGEVLYDHDRCRAATSQQCTASAGEHKHTVTNLNQVYCHDDHACPAGEVLYDHDRCRVASSSLTPQQRCANSGGLWSIYGCWHQPSCPSGQQWLPSGSVNGACTPCPSGQHSHDTCHADHDACETGFVRKGHDQCERECAPSPGFQHRHADTNTCHTNHNCPTDQHIYEHKLCHADHTTANTCDAGEHLDGHDTCHDDHTTANTCNTGQVLQGHDDCVDATSTTTKTTTPSDTTTTVPAPISLAAVCGTDGQLRVTWNVTPLSFSKPSRLFEVNIDGQDQEPVYYLVLDTSPPSFTFTSPTPNNTYSVKVRERLVVGSDTSYSSWVSTSARCPRWVPQNVTASCNSHGVVTLQWDHVDGSTKYKTVGINYEGRGGTGETRRVHAQRQEGGTYKFQVRAYSASAWGAASTVVSVTCDGLNPRHPTASSAWRSPNATQHYNAGSISWVNPNVARLVPSEATMNSGAAHCTADQPKTGGGRTRTCTFEWTEPLNIALSDELISDLGHGRTVPHGAESWHVYKTSAGHADNALHRHCATHDVNGDGDTEDTQDNDGTCPGADTDIPDLAWHPTLPNKDDPFWRDVLLSAGITTPVGKVAAVAAKAGLLKLGLAAGTVAVSATVIGVVFAVGLALLYAWLKDNRSTITIAGHTGCLDPPQSTSWQSDRWASVENSFTETKQAHGYETVYKHVIHSCDSVEST